MKISTHSLNDPMAPLTLSIWSRSAMSSVSASSAACWWLPSLYVEPCKYLCLLHDLCSNNLHSSSCIISSHYTSDGSRRASLVLFAAFVCLLCSVPCFHEFASCFDFPQLLLPASLLLALRATEDLSQPGFQRRKLVRGGNPSPVLQGGHGPLGARLKEGWQQILWCAHACACVCISPRAVYAEVKSI